MPAHFLENYQHFASFLISFFKEKKSSFSHKIVYTHSRGFKQWRKTQGKICGFFLNKPPQIQPPRNNNIIIEILLLDVTIISTSFQISVLGVCTDEMLVLAE